MNCIRAFIASAFVAVVLLSSCTEEADPKTYFDYYTTSLGYEGGTVSNRIYSNGSWAITSTHDGVEISPSEGYGDTDLIVTVPQNDSLVTVAVRVTAVTTIGSSTFSKKMVIAQGAHPFVFCEENEKEAPAAGGKVRFYVNSNYKWSVAGVVVSDGSVFSGAVIPEKWDVNGVNVEVQIPANASGKALTYTITLKLDDYSESAVLTVNQPA